MKRVIGVLTMAYLVWGSGLQAADEKPAEAAKKDQAPAEPPPPPIKSATTHNIVIGGAPLGYTATAGTLIVRNDKDKPYASIGYVAYTRSGVTDAAKRPLTFAYNGGPGSSSVWLHMGVLGPRRVVVTDPGPTPPPPYSVVDNAYSILDKTDLVMIDPVSTGVSKAVGEAKDKDFWGVDPDIESISRFILQYVTENDRWNSPKYLLGESYGTTRSAGIVDYLQSGPNMSFNGVVLVSVALDLEAVFDLPGNDRTFPFFLPTYAAVAWYHKVLPSRPEKLEPFLDEVRRFALGEYATALLKGSALPAEERKAVAAKLHAYSGVSVDYIEKANLRVTEGQFAQELLREHGITVARLDARFTGPTLDLLGKEAAYDPQSAAISAAYTAAFLDYYHRELKFPKDKTYAISGDVFAGWDFKHKTPGSGFALPTLTNTGPDLAHALAYNPHLRVLVLNGLYDLATPFAATEYMVSHLGLDSKLQSHVEMKYYEAGHMMYVNEPSLKKFKEDVAGFIDRTVR